MGFDMSLKVYPTKTTDTNSFPVYYTTYELFPGSVPPPNYDFFILLVSFWLFIRRQEVIKSDPIG